MRFAGRFEISVFVSRLSSTLKSSADRRRPSRLRCCVLSSRPPSSPPGISLQRRRLCRADIKEEFAPSACLLYA